MHLEAQPFFRVVVVAFVVACGATARTSKAVQYTTVDFSANFNQRLQDAIGLPDADLDPSGTTTLAGVPFAIPSAGMNSWSTSLPAPDAGERVLSVPVSIPNATTLHSLINTFWGQAGPVSYAMLELFGTGGAYARIDLVGNQNVRDFNNFIWTNSAPEAVEVLSWNFSGQRMDEQTWTLPGSFLGQTLTEIRVTDDGGDQFQRVFVSGLTVASVPEPSASVLAGLGVVGAVLFAVRRRAA